ncbi:hypothetical protein [Psychrobacter sp. I-STPA10]|uniref:hypothetical protein n=1 Tax=Psychrobacter sp. I-STPA10 TaxID=2585769 RepID=UPI001E4AE1B1|nr:hypothetical protein [Psychrobacter sp. I-STPA10]
MSMFNNSPVARRIQANAQTRTQQAQFDAMSAAQAAEKIEFDPISERMAIHANAQMRLAALQIVFMLAAIIVESDGADEEDLLPSEILDLFMLDVFDDDDDNDGIDSTVKAVLAAHISDALSTMGVNDGVIDDIFDDDIDIADAAIETASEIIIENMPDDGNDFDEFVAAFAYGMEEDATYDSLEQDALESEVQFDSTKSKKKKLRAGKKTTKKVNGKTVVYKAVKAIRNGKKVVVNKRISGEIKLSSAQKAALRKAKKKAHAPAAIRKQMRSFSKGLKMNIYNITDAQAKGLTNASLKRHSRSIGIK